MRTSITHPLLIAEVPTGAGMGNIGITFCPGKCQAAALTGAWARDLDLDLDVVMEWNAAAVVTLVETHELQSLRVPDLGVRVLARGIAWYHLPIRDVSTPTSAFEAEWARVGEELRARVRAGCNVLIHCKGGLGRAGTIAARLLVELGWKPDEAILAVRAARPGAIETASQLRHVKGAKPVPEAAPATSKTAYRDRAVGALLGLAVGDALGTTLEFRGRDSYPMLTDMVGGGPFNLKAGQWTDDTSMALALAESLIDQSGLDEADLMSKFVRWHEDGEYSATGRCFDIGITTSQALRRWKTTGNPIAGSTASDTAGNGSLMRLAPVAVRYWQTPDQLRDVAARQSRTTHAAPEAVDACVAYADVLADAIAGQRRSQVLRSRDGTYSGAIATIMAGSWRGKRRDAINASGYVAHSLEAALWCISRTASFEEAVLLAANLGEDADTTAAITGQLAGAMYGASTIPAHWRQRLAWEDRITKLAISLFEGGMQASGSAGEDMERTDIATRASWPEL